VAHLLIDKMSFYQIKIKEFKIKFLAGYKLTIHILI